jgi:ubiquinone/menaquinone biosynthesis C-methylase UbiE
MRTKLLPLLLLPVIALLSAGPGPEFSYKTHGNVANYFENEAEMRDYFNFQKGDWVAEVGAGSGLNMPGFSFIADSVDFYAEDIDSAVLNNKHFNKLVKQCMKAKQKAPNRFYRCIGTTMETRLPENTFDKIILVSTFHEFSSKEEMLRDLYRKLKPNGKLYILEVHCGAKTHTNATAEQTISLLEQNGFVLEKKDGKDRNGSSGLYRVVFRKKSE